MHVYSVTDKEFTYFGRIIPGDFSEVLGLLKDSPMPKEGTIYCPGDPKIELDHIVSYFRDHVYGHMDIQIGYCNGHNQKLNCLEFHKGNEVNMANEDFILLLGSYFDIVDGKFDSSKVKAFRVPVGVAVEIYATTLHYAPCGIGGSGFKVLVVLPKGTNTKPDREKDDPLLWATNKWLLAHKDTKEAKEGAYIGITGDNLSI